MFTIEVVLYDGFDELDALGPYEVFRTAQANGAEIHAELVGAHGPATITASHGTRIVVERGPSGGAETTAGAADMIVVPGGGWNTRGGVGAWAEAQGGDLPARIAAIHRGGAMVASVCTGAMLLATARITNGRRATTHHVAIEDLRASGAVVVDARVVDDGDLITAGGVTSGIDLALLVVERQAGREVADRVAHEIEYERRYEPAEAC